MKRTLSARLFEALFSFALLIFLAATAIVVTVSWTVYEGDAEERLSSQARATAEEVAGLDAAETAERLSTVMLSGIRITLVAADGTVLYDSEVDPATMTNHGDREEIIAARNGDESLVFRVSETTGTDALYTAVLLDEDGLTLRLSETRTSLASFLGRLIAPLILAAFVAVGLSAVFAKAITKHVTAPLLDVDLESPMQSDGYREIDPLLARIDAQRTELVSKNEQLESAMAMRREFTGNVSHEMKSPLQVIGGYAELIESGMTNEEDTKEFAALIRSESEAMRVLIDDVLMLSRLDEGVEEESYPIDLASICQRVVIRLEPTANAHGAKVNITCKEPVYATGYEMLAEQAVYNLVDNALRYGGGEVEIDLSTSGDIARITISDNGHGVPEGMRERIFERFFRLDTSRSRSTGGTGLGLAIVKHAAEVMGGSVSVTDSSLGGASFMVTLPKANGVEASRPRPDS